MVSTDRTGFERKIMRKKFCKWFGIIGTAVLLTLGTIWTFNLVRYTEGKIALMNPGKLTIAGGKVIDQEDYSVNRSDVVYVNCKNNCLARVRYTKVMFENSSEYYYLNGNITENLLGKKVKIYYDKDKRIFPKGHVNSFGLFIDNKEIIPVISKRDRDSKSVYVYLMMMVFADITALGMLLLILWEDSVLRKNNKKKC